MAKYRIDSTEPRTDGTGMIAFDVWALDDDDLVIPGKHATILCPYVEVQAVINATPAAAKLEALKQMLIRNRPDGTWDSDALTLAIANNLNAADVDSDFDDLLGTVGGYPYTFSL